MLRGQDFNLDVGAMLGSVREVKAVRELQGELVLSWREGNLCAGLTLPKVDVAGVGRHGFSRRDGAAIDHDVVVTREVHLFAGGLDLDALGAHLDLHGQLALVHHPLDLLAWFEIGEEYLRLGRDFGQGGLVCALGVFVRTVSCLIMLLLGGSLFVRLGLCLVSGRLRFVL